MTLRTVTGETVTIDNDEIEERRAQSVSLMPDGLASKLKQQHEEEEIDVQADAP
jgi:hypothetical protein